MDLLDQLMTPGVTAQNLVFPPCPLVTGTYRQFQKKEHVKRPQVRFGKAPLRQLNQKRLARPLFGPGVLLNAGFMVPVLHHALLDGKHHMDPQTIAHRQGIRQAILRPHQGGMLTLATLPLHCLVVNDKRLIISRIELER